MTRTATIDELEVATELDHESAEKRRIKCQMEIQSILDVTRRDGRPNLTAEEDQRVAGLFAAIEEAKADKEGIRNKLAQIKKLRAQELETGARMQEVTATGAKLPHYDEVARVGRAERTYNPDNDRKGAAFLKDVIAQHLFGDVQASTRLAHHMHEEGVERARSGYRVERAVSTGSFTGLVVPQYLTDMYAPAVAAMRPFADICNHHDLPDTGMTVNISRITQPTAATIQATENTPVVETDADDTLLTENILTIAGSQVISRQAIERGTGIEEVLVDDLFRRYATTQDSTLINQAVTGLSAVAASVPYTDASPSGVEMWPKILAGFANSEAALLGFAQPNAVIMHSRRWYWLQSQLSAQWPLVQQPGLTDNHFAANYAKRYGEGVRGILPNGAVVIVDNNVPINLGEGTNQDEVYIVATDECHLWETPSSPIFLRCEQPAAANLGVLLVLYGYIAFSMRRYANAMSKISGNGLIQPVF